MYGGHFGFGWLGMIFVWGFFIWLIVWLVSQNKSAGQKETGKTPLEIAKERYAKGELTKKEFEFIKKELQ